MNENNVNTSSGSNGNGNGHKHPLPGIQPVTGGQVVRGGNILSLNETSLPPAATYEQTEVLTGDTEQFNKIQQAIYDLLDAFNVNWEDPNYTETPARVARAYVDFWANGYARQAEDEVTIFPNSSGIGDMVMVKDMQFYSLCSHHLAPFKGHAAIAYMPNQHLLGLSKLGRILDIYARRFQLQERIGAQTADKIMELLVPQGVMVILYNVEHMCMSSRGVELHEANTTTTASRGVFASSPELRMEVMSLLKT